MLILLLCAVLSTSQEKIDFHEFNIGNYTSFRDKIEKNHFLVTLSIKSSKKYQFYKDFFIDISNDISNYFHNKINVSYILLLDPNFNIEFGAIFYIYLSGISEMEVSIYPRLSVSFNTNKIINGCLQQAIALRRLEKEQKSPEIARIKNELRQIAKVIKRDSVSHSTKSKLLNDYNLLTDELMQYIPENKQKERRLRLQQQIITEDDRKYKKLAKEIKKEKEIRSKYIQKNQHELSQHKLDKLAEKQIIEYLRQASEDSSLNVVKSAFVGAYNIMKKGIIRLFNSTTKNRGDDL